MPPKITRATWSLNFHQFWIETDEGAGKYPRMYRVPDRSPVNGPSTNTNPIWLYDEIALYLVDS